MRANLAIFLLALLTGPLISRAEALETRVSTAAGIRTLRLSGEFERKDRDKVRAALQQSGAVDEVAFDSPGGNLFGGLEVGELMREQNLVTRVPSGSSCASACVYAFLGGRIRYVDPGSRVGVHMSTLTHNEQFRNKLAQAIRKRDEISVRVGISVIEQSAARAAATQAEYLVRMGISLRLMVPAVETDNWEVHWLTRTEIEDYNVANSR